MSDIDGLDGLLAALEPTKNADTAGLPEGWRLGTLSEAGIGGCVTEFVTKRVGNQIKKILTAESKALLKAWPSTLKIWPVRDLSTAEARDIAEQQWERRSIELHEQQARDWPTSKAQPTVESKGTRPILRIVRV